MRTWLSIAVIFALPVGPAIVTGLGHPRSPWRAGTERWAITVEQALALRDALWIDARSDDAYADAHIPGALPLNEDDGEERLDAVMLAWRPTQTIIVYCDGGGCQASRHVAERLREAMAGAEVRVLKDGWEAWVNREPEP